MPPQKPTIKFTIYNQKSDFQRILKDYANKNIGLGLFSWIELSPVLQDITEQQPSSQVMEQQLSKNKEDLDKVSKSLSDGQGNDKEFAEQLLQEQLNKLKGTQERLKVATDVLEGYKKRLLDSSFHRAISTSEFKPSQHPSWEKDKLHQINPHKERPYTSPEAVFGFIGSQNKKWVVRKLYLNESIEKALKQHPEHFAVESVITDSKAEAASIMTLVVSPFIKNGSLLAQAKALAKEFNDEKNISKQQAIQAKKLTLAQNVLIQVTQIQKDFIQSGVFYPDFKLANVLDGGKISDVKSLSPYQAKLTCARGQIKDSTTYYWPPEVHNNANSVETEKVFAYQLGLMIYEALVPNKMRELKDAFQNQGVGKHTAIRPDFYDSIFETKEAKDLKTIISNLTHENSQQRWTAEQACEYFYSRQIEKYLSSINNIPVSINDEFIKAHDQELNQQFSAIKAEKNDLPKFGRLQKLHEKCEATLKFAQAYQNVETNLAGFYEVIKSINDATVQDELNKTYLELTKECGAIYYSKEDLIVRAPQMQQLHKKCEATLEFAQAYQGVETAYITYTRPNSQNEAGASQDEQEKIAANSSSTALEGFSRATKNFENATKNYNKVSPTTSLGQACIRAVKSLISTVTASIVNVFSTATANSILTKTPYSDLDKIQDVVEAQKFEVIDKTIPRKASSSDSNKETFSSNPNLLFGYRGSSGSCVPVFCKR